MKSIGVVRKIDELGRIVIPKELRDRYNMEQFTPVEIFTDRGDIIIRKYQETCFLCNNSGDYKLNDGTAICRDCQKKIAALEEV